VEQALDGFRVGVDGPWVYPILAFVPMLASMVLGPDLYGIGWMIMVTIADAAVFAYLVVPARPGLPGTRLRLSAAWWWVAFLLLLGPVSVGRIDIFTVDLVIVGLLVMRNHPAFAGVLLAIATWVKVWPAALIVGAIVAVRRRLRVAVGAVITLVAVAVGVLAMGAGMNAFSFVGEQTGRGLQVEAPISTIWMWLAFAGDRTQVYYNQDILTFQVTGPGANVAAAITTPLLVIAVAVILVLAFFVVRSGAASTVVLPPLSLAMVTALILFNKVGSPQFMVWLSAPIILGIVTQGRRFFWPAIMAFVMGGLTQIIYPIAYDWVLGLDPLMLTVLTVRNLLTASLFAISLVMLWQSRKHGRRMDSDARGIFGSTFRRTVAGR
jgi:hypothetical protein